MTKAKLPHFGPSAAAVILAGCASTGAPMICSDYLSTRNCIGGRYLEGGHHGIDFRADPGTEVISATRGTVTRLQTDPCYGYSITVATDLVSRMDGVDEPVYAVYAHAKPIDGLKVSRKLNPGEPIGRVIPLLGTTCYGSREHVHYELRVRNAASRHIDPHQFWADGPGRVSCFKPGTEVPSGRAVAPVRCAADASRPEQG